MIASTSSMPASARPRRLDGTPGRARRQALRNATALAVAATLLWPAAAAGAVEPTGAGAHVEAAGLTPVDPASPTDRVAPTAPATDPAPDQTDEAAPAADDASPTPTTPEASATAPEPTPETAPPSEVAAAAVTTASLSGRVTDSTGAPLAGVQVLVGDAEPGDDLPVTAADGTWSVGGLAAGSHRVTFWLMGDAHPYPLYWDGTTYGSYRSPGTPVTMGAGQSRGGIDVTYIDNRASGTVTADGAPVAGASVQVFARMFDSQPVESAVTAADGTWTARWLRPGSYHVRVVPPAGSGLAATLWGQVGNQYNSVTFIGATARTEHGIVVDLPVESTLTGRVVDAAGNPVGRTMVALWSSTSSHFLSGGAIAHAPTAADGTYTFSGLGSGDYTVQVAHPSSSLFVPAFLGGALDARHAVWTTIGPQAHGSVIDLVQQQGGTISGRVVGIGGEDHMGAPVEIVAADGSVVQELRMTGAGDHLTFATPTAIPPGAYRARTGGGSGLVFWWAGGSSAETARVLNVTPGGHITDVEIVVDDAHLSPPRVPAVEELTDALRGTVTTVPSAAPGATVTISGLTPGDFVYVWLASTPVGLGYVDVAADGTASVTIPAGTAAGAHRLVVTDLAGTVLGWTDVSVLAAGTPTASAAPGTPTAQRGLLAATGFETAGILGLALAAVLVGGGLVWFRRRAVAAR